MFYAYVLIIHNMKMSLVMYANNTINYFLQKNTKFWHSSDVKNLIITK